MSTLFHSLVGRNGVTPDTARTIVRTNTTVIGALAVKRGEADALICGLQGRFIKHVRDIRSVDRAAGRACKMLSALSHADHAARRVLPHRHLRQHRSRRPTRSSRIALQARDHLKRFNIEAKAALLSYSNFGSRDGDSAFKMREAYQQAEGGGART